MTRLQDAISWLRKRDLLLLSSVLVVVIGIWCFVALAVAVSTGSTQEFDERTILLMRNPDDPSDPLGAHWVKEAGRDLTALGGYLVLTLVTSMVAVFLLVIRKYGALTLLLVATLGGLALSHLLKDLIDRTRPDVVPHLSHVSTASFPSGHSMMSAVVYLTLGSLLARLVKRQGLKAYFVVVAMLLSVLVGISRVYLGVHYPTDVLAGWSAGLVWALMCTMAARHLQRRGAVETSTD